MAAQLSRMAVITLFIIASVSSFGQLTLTTSPYTENFNDLASGLPAGWSVRTGANDISPGLAQTFNANPVSWGSSTGQFANAASPEGLLQNSSVPVQAAHGNRAPALRQTSGFGDPGGAFVLQLAHTQGLSNLQISFRILQLDPTSTMQRTTTWHVDYATGNNPTSFINAATDPSSLTTTLGIWSDVAVSVDFGNALDNISETVWIRIAAKTSTTGSGSRPMTAIDDFVLEFSACNSSVYFADADGDGYGDPLVMINACEAPAGYVENNEDCNDSDPALHPGINAWLNYSSQSLCPGDSLVLQLLTDFPQAEQIRWFLDDGQAMILLPFSEEHLVVHGPGTYHAVASTGGCIAETAQVQILPASGPASFTAGANQNVCGGSALLAATLPQGCTGIWSLVHGGGNFSGITDPQSEVSGLEVGQNIFRWTVTNGACVSFSEVIIMREQMPAIAHAGPDLKSCGMAAALMGNGTGAVTGAWSVVSGPGTALLADPADPETTVSVSEPGVYIFRWTIAHGQCISHDDMEAVFNAPPAVNSGSSQQQIFYGDMIAPVMISAEDEDSPPGSLQIHAVSYTLNGGEPVAALPPGFALLQNNAGSWTLAPAQELPDAGNYIITFQIKDECEAVGSTTHHIMVQPANALPQAEAFYTGSCFFWTTGNSKTATLHLAATLRNKPGMTGDIRTAKASFYTRNGNLLIPVQGAQNLAVGLVDPADTGTGSASAIVQYHIGSTDAEVLNIAVLVTGNYTADDPATDKLITIAVPSAGSQACGGGEFLQDGSAGILAGAAGTAANFGFQIQYNKSLKNPQGNFELIFRSYNEPGGTVGNVLRTFRVKSSSIQVYASGNPGQAQITARGNLSEIINGVESGIEGNCIILLEVLDGFHYLPETADLASITVFRNKGGIWYSSSWSGLATVPKEISSGNISVTAAPAVQKQMAIGGEDSLRIYPNPSAGQFRILIPDKEKVDLRIYDAGGRLIERIFPAATGPVSFGERYARGIYYAVILSGNRRTQISLVKL